MITLTFPPSCPLKVKGNEGRLSVKYCVIVFSSNALSPSKRICISAPVGAPSSALQYLPPDPIKVLIYLCMSCLLCFDKEFWGSSLVPCFLSFIDDYYSSTSLVLYSFFHWHQFLPPLCLSFIIPFLFASCPFLYVLPPYSLLSNIPSWFLKLINILINSTKRYIAIKMIEISVLS